MIHRYLPHTMFGKTARFLLGALLPAAACTTALADTPPAPAAIAYICQLPGGGSIRTALPQGRCRPVSAASSEPAAEPADQAASAPAPTVAIPTGRPADRTAGGSELPDLWQQAVSDAGDIQVASSPVAMRVTLRRQPERRTANVFRPAPIIQPARPLTAKEIITRDIRREERALAQAERELAGARRRNQSARAGSLQLQIADRRSGLHSLRQELRRHQ